MASAATVAADAARSPLGRETDETNGITSAITANDDEHTGLTDDEAEEEDEDVVTKSRRGQRQPAPAPAADIDEDLFGDESDTGPVKVRHLDDEELDSGDDEGREDRIGDEEQGGEHQMEERTKQIQAVELPRMPVPEPSDGELYLLKVPKFLSIAPRGFVQDEFEAPKSDHHARTPSKNFSAYDTAMSTIRWRRSPTDASQLQSNARINRWSDGSLTLQFASKPTMQYDLKGNALVPPQRNPILPTPTSTQTNDNTGGRSGMNGHLPDRAKFDASKHAFTYLVMPLPNEGLMKITHAITTGLTVAPPEDHIDEAIVNLQQDLAVASGGRKINGGAVAFTDNMEDPELAKKRAEQAEREKARARKKADAQLERERDRSNRALGRSGLSSSRYGGLNAGMLEDDEGMATTKGRGAARPKAPRRRRANSEYSSEEDYGRRGFKASKEDDYDVEDDFVANSDEEEEEVAEDEDEDEDEGIIEEGRAAARREGTPKRSRPTQDEEQDAEGEEDDADAVTTVDRKKRRLIVDDEDEDE